MMTRRQAIQRTTLATAAVAVGSSLVSVQAQTAGGPFTLPLLPYSYDALEPYIDAPTMQIHHDKHHAAYVTNLNKAVAEHPDLAKKKVEELLKDLSSVPEKIRTAVRNHGGGHYNHSLFWQMLKNGSGGAPKAALAGAIDKSFGSFAGFKDKFTDAATKVFGSGWAWLVLDGKAVKIEPSPNQDSPVSQGRHVLLGLDVWEHAYYLKYQNKRADYIAAWFNVINWDFVSERFEKLA